jgi:hypothetical protein
VKDNMRVSLSLTHQRAHAHAWDITHSHQVRRSGFREDEQSAQSQTAHGWEVWDLKLLVRGSILAFPQNPVAKSLSRPWHAITQRQEAPSSLMPPSNVSRQSCLTSLCL